MGRWKINKNNDRKELYDIEIKKKEAYSNDNIFKNKKKSIEENEDVTSMTITKKSNFLKKIMDKIKEKLKLT